MRTKFGYIDRLEGYTNQVRIYDVIQNWQTTEDIKTWTLFANSALPQVACPSGRITCSYLASVLHASDPNPRGLQI
ncbi:hypothetical protein ig2599ANME_1612 [groundwater metagenome]